MARVTSNGAVVTNDGYWYWSGWKWVALVPNPPEKAPGPFSSERLGLVTVIKGMSIRQMKEAGEELARLTKEHGGSLREAEASSTPALSAVGHEPAEPTLRTEQVKGPGGKGWLELTPTRLLFRREEGKPPDLDLPLAKVEGGRYKKAFRAGVEILEIVYQGDTGKRETRSFERMSWAQWANRNGRQEQNSFASFERDLTSARERLILGSTTATPAVQIDRVAQLEKLAQLRTAGVLSYEEFEREKARILSS